MFELSGIVDTARIYHQIIYSTEAALTVTANSSEYSFNRPSLIVRETSDSNQATIAPDNENFNYSGRVSWQDENNPFFAYPGTAVRFKFTGTSLKIELAEDGWGSENYIDVYLDDRPKPITIKLQKNGDRPIIYEVASGLEDKIHSVKIVKRTDYVTGGFKFHGIIIDGELLSANPDSNKKIEVYGDSISAGAVVEHDRAGEQDPEGDTYNLHNAYHSYGSILARKYDAEVSLIAQSGASLIDGFGYWNQGTGMEAFYDKSAPLDDAPQWNFAEYNPDLVIIALGQNDSATIEIGETMTAKAWKDSYKRLIADIRAKRPNAYFIGMFPNMYHDRQWDTYLTEAIAEYRQEYNDDRVFSLIHEQVTPGHPRISEQQLMAEALKEFIDRTLVNSGFNWNLAEETNSQ